LEHDTVQVRKLPTDEKLVFRNTYRKVFNRLYKQSAQARAQGIEPEVSPKEAAMLAAQSALAAYQKAQMDDSESTRDE
jgi:hypothetical protein